MNRKEKRMAKKKLSEEKSKNFLFSADHFKRFNFKETLKANLLDKPLTVVQ